MVLLFACGGTGGHIFPALSVGEELRRRDPAARILYVCGKKDIESEIFGVARGEEVAAIEAAPYRGVSSLARPAFLLRSARGFFQSLALIRRERPTVAVGFGGYVSFPVLGAAKICGVRTMIHEQNVRPGLANRLLAKQVNAVAMSFPETRKYWPAVRNMRVTGNPIRASIERGCHEEALSFFGFSADKKILLVLGGSQGAESINTLFLECLKKLPASMKDRLQVLHLCGSMSAQDSESACRKEGVAVKAYSFFDRMDLAYGAADLCVGRAGATFLAEVRTKKIPVLLVPYPYGDGHQRANAEMYRNLIGARVCEQKDLDGEKLAKILEEMIQQVFSIKYGVETGLKPVSTGMGMGTETGTRLAQNARVALAEFIEECARKI